MIAPTPEMLSDLAAERRDRLRTVLKMRAPDVIIADNCRLVLKSYCGNSHWRVIGWLVRQLIVSKYHWCCDGLQWRLHAAARACGLHLPFTADLLDGTVGCWVCDAQRNAAPQDQETEESE